MGRAVLVAIALLAGACGGPPPPRPPPPPLRVSVEEVRFDAVDREVAQEAIAESVRVRAAAEHLDLPEAVVDGGPDPDAWPAVTVLNDTAHGMVIWMSGPCARTIALPPHTQNSAEVCAGTYQIAGQVADGHFLPIVGERDQLGNGYHYTFTFYVQSNPYRTRRRRRQ